MQNEYTYILILTLVPYFVIVNLIMSEIEYDNMRLQQSILLCKEYFNIDLDIKNVLFDDITTGKDSYGLLFKTDRNHLYALCVSKNQQTFRDVKKIISSMGLSAETYYPPHGEENYFANEGYKVFQKVYPGRTSTWNDHEQKFYTSLAPYNIALVKVESVNGEIRRYAGSRSGWLKTFDFSYKHMKVQSV